MLEKLKQRWHHFEEAPPGERFQQRFERRQQDRRFPFQKVLYITAGMLIMIAGLFFLPAPGPGTLILLIGAGLMAQESLVAARILDWVEVRLRQLATWCLAVHRRSPLRVTILLLLSTVAVTGTIAYGVYMLLFVM